MFWHGLKRSFCTTLRGYLGRWLEFWVLTVRQRRSTLARPAIDTAKAGQEQFRLGAGRLGIALVGEFAPLHEFAGRGQAGAGKAGAVVVGDHEVKRRRALAAPISIPSNCAEGCGNRYIYIPPFTYTSRHLCLMSGRLDTKIAAMPKTLPERPPHPGALFCSWGWYLVR